MPDATTWSVIASGVVGVSGVLVAGWGRWLDHRSDERRAKRERFDELRTAMDDAADVISQTIRAADDARVSLLRARPEDDSGIMDDDPTRWWAKHSVDAVRDELSTVWMSENRLRLRLGPEHAIVQAYDRMTNAFQDATVVLDEIQRHQAGGAAHTKRLSCLDECRAAAIRAQRDYFRESAERVGP